MATEYRENQERRVGSDRFEYVHHIITASKRRLALEQYDFLSPDGAREALIAVDRALAEIERFQRVARTLKTLFRESKQGYLARDDSRGGR